MRSGPSRLLAIATVAALSFAALPARASKSGQRPAASRSAKTPGHAAPRAPLNRLHLVAAQRAEGPKAIAIRHPRVGASLAKLEFRKNLIEAAATDGPRTTKHSVRDHAALTALGAVAVGAIGAGAMAAGLDGEPFAIGLSAGAGSWLAAVRMPAIRVAHGVARARLIGRDLVWPALLFGVTTAVGHFIGDPAGSAAAAGAEIAGAGYQLSDLIRAFLSAAIIGGDAPAIAVTAYAAMEEVRAEKRSRAAAAATSRAESGAPASSSGAADHTHAP